MLSAPDDMFLAIVVPLPYRATIALSLTCKSLQRRINNKFWCRKIEWQTQKYTKCTKAKKRYKRYISSGTPNMKLPIHRRDIVKVDSCEQATVLVSADGECLLYLGTQVHTLCSTAKDALVYRKGEVLAVAILMQHCIEWLFMDSATGELIDKKVIEENHPIAELLTLRLEFNASISPGVYCVVYKLANGTVKYVQSRVSQVTMYMDYIVYDGALACFFSTNFFFIVTRNFGVISEKGVEYKQRPDIRKVVRYGRKTFLLTSSIIKDVAVVKGTPYTLRRDGTLKRYTKLIDTNVLFLRSTYNADSLCYIVEPS